MPTKQPQPGRGFLDCNEDLTVYRTEVWLAELSRKTWTYLQRLESVALTQTDDDAWTAHELNQAHCRLKTLEWLRVVNLSRKA